MKVVGVDPSLLATGVCVLDSDRPDWYRTFLLHRGKASGEMEKIERLLSIAKDIIAVIADEKADAFGMEAPARNQIWQAAPMGELHGVIKSQVYMRFGFVPIVTEASKMRRVVVGKIEKTFKSTKDRKGNEKRVVNYGEIDGKRGKKRRATVKDIIEMRLAERGLFFQSQDEMDAYVVAKFCLGQLTGV